eukprot:CAMPEP_0176471896 /NCGR_PEP_ID=MMETSP0127-20121128/41418_1 /TAXON_ID=938130 /ORGANISM="Platyophrya macrostoma, Strain WH" /LENGTH=62 /DNA_ID=CAMNT_0017866657 /DNA_START=512 /DNA_END=700 /DNA_ORIENTATION=-
MVPSISLEAPDMGSTCSAPPLLPLADEEEWLPPAVPPVDGEDDEKGSTSRGIASDFAIIPRS